MPGKGIGIFPEELESKKPVLVKYLTLESVFIWNSLLPGCVSLGQAEENSYCCSKKAVISSLFA